LATPRWASCSSPSRRLDHQKRRTDRQRDGAGRIQELTNLRIYELTDFVRSH
jgi:hypothetical protein